MKQDINQMKKDIPKYIESGLFPSGAKEKWDDLLTNFDLKYGKLPQESNWILDEFQSLSVRCTQSEVHPVISDKVLKQAQASKAFRKVHKYLSSISCMYL